MSDAVEKKDPVKTLRKHGRSFYFAYFFLGRDTARKAARLYSFCRMIDDLVDEQDPAEGTETLRRISSDIKRGFSTDPNVRDFLDLAEDCKIDTQAALHLIEGVVMDAGPVRLTTMDDLVQYSYRVAGTVGLMMCPILGCHEEQAKSHAIDMGIAMQLTNIARDVLEDAKKDRRYLPKNRIGGISPGQIVEAGPAEREHVRDALRQVLKRADEYYRSGEAGLSFLPRRNHLTILIAARIYRHIGVRLRNGGCDVWAGREIVPFTHKIGLACQSLFEFIFAGMFRARPASHNLSLHLNLQGFPGTHNPSAGEDTDKPKRATG